MHLGNGSDGYLTLRNIEKLRRIRSRLAEGGTIVLQSCSTARGEGFEGNMANAFSEIFSQAEHVFAPRVPAGSRVIFDANNQVSGIKYENNEAGVVSSINLRTHETNLTERGYDAVAGKKIAEQIIETIDQQNLDFIISSDGDSRLSGEDLKNQAMTEGDRAMNVQEKGGIDLTPANMNLQTQNTGEGIKFRLDPAMLKQLQNAPGFVPVIINIQPMTDLREFLGLNDSSALKAG
jgi:hypothetical protein